MNKKPAVALTEKSALQGRVDDVVARLYEVSARIGAEFVSKFEAFKVEDPAAIYDRRWGYVDKTGTVNFSRAPIKYALEAELHMSQKLRYLEFFQDVTSAFDIGVGAGQLLLLLRDAFGIPVTGIDAPDAKGAFLYRAFREALVIEDQVQMFEVVAGVDVPIPDGVDAVLCFYPIFDRGWGVEEHDWFVQMCRRHYAKKIYWRFLTQHLNPDIFKFYQGLGARCPRIRGFGFMILDL
jgi:hypothetical protein